VIALGERLGLPRIGTARPLALAMMIDAFGSGLFLPFSLLYFHYAGGLSLTEAGLGLTISMLIAVPTPLAAGALVDRVGPKTVAVTTNAARVAGFLGYLLVHDLTALIAVALLVSVSDRLFWVAQPTLIGEFATSGSRDRWFGLTVALRAAGLGIGGLMAGLAVSRLGVTGYHALAIAQRHQLRIRGDAGRQSTSSGTSCRGGAVARDKSQGLQGGPSRPALLLDRGKQCGVWDREDDDPGWLPGVRRPGTRRDRVARRGALCRLHCATRGRADQLGSSS